MANTIEENATIVLKALGSQMTDEMGRVMLNGEELTHVTDLLPAQINDAVTVLVETGLAEWEQLLGTAPYVFGRVGITPRGRYELERMESAEKSEMKSEQKVTPIQRTPTPVGSPYGFQDEDWESVTERKSATSNLNVVLGYQFVSKHYDTGKLQENVREDFQKAVDQYNAMPGSAEVELVFNPLAAGYGEHLFNEIARDIIASDIAVFDTSDMNPNVMVEMGVALTWGVRVLPIKKEGCPKPPSDISGQTWADYRNSGEEFTDKDHGRKLLRMVERAIRKKGKA